MPKNPNRSSQGGDVEGETPIVVTQGEEIKVSSASYDAGYDLGNTLSDAETAFAKDDLKTGFCSYGKTIGE